jgi:TPR repeat protein
MTFRHLLVAVLVGTGACSSAQSSSNLVPQLEQLAERGNAEALYHLGMAYWTGTGVSKDIEMAVKYFERAAEKGDPLGAYKLGCLYDGQDGVFAPNPDKALEQKLIAARAGYALAQQDVAALYAKNDEVTLALEWIEKAARQGTSGALMTYASIHNGAPGIKPDPVKTAAYFRLYIERSEADAKQRAWIRSFEKKLSAEERGQVESIVKAYRPEPTPLTLKALRGADAAEDLVARR